MANVFDLFHMDTLQRLEESRLLSGELINKKIREAESEIQSAANVHNILSSAANSHLTRINETHTKRAQALLSRVHDLVDQCVAQQRLTSMDQSWSEYLTDASERAILTLDALRKRGDVFLEHEESGCPPVLIYDYELVMDGRDQLHPSNYQLLRILPPEEVVIDQSKRPYIVIDPRAGHGPGIGGFKTDSQVGVALRAGHPVYFVSFRREPEPGQYISSVTRTEAAFVREVMRLHPQSPKPVVIGNCQGGWATLLLAATNPDLTGPIVINGAPVAPWAGKVGQNPMRYNAGVLGGAWIPMFLSDLGGGIFDGAHLVQNFEMLNPGRTLFRKYTDLFRDIDKGDESFIDFETWWGGFFLLNEAEIRWIVEQLFVGNRLVKNEARIEPGRPVDLKSIKAPIIVFASHGDNITPPQQALNWIAETYSDVSEIRIRGQRIVYMVHDQVGHLGIFVSSQIANKEHTEMASTLQTIEALAPGLYEMRIEDISDKDGTRHFTVGFVERTLADIRALDDGFDDEKPFAAVARASEVQAQIYDSLVRPWVKAAVTSQTAEMSRALHPQRLSRAVMSSRNPMMNQVAEAASKIRVNRNQADQDNPYLAMESLCVEATEQCIDLTRDIRDMGFELFFYSAWANPWMSVFGRTHEARRTLKSSDELRGLPEVTQALYAIEQGGFAEAVIRMLVLLAENRRQVRRDRLERSSRVLTHDEPFKSLGAGRLAMMIHQQTLIATFEPDRAIDTLPILLPEQEDRERALQVVQFIPGAIEEMSDHTQNLLQRFRKVLGMSTVLENVLEDPLAEDAMPFSTPSAIQVTPKPKKTSSTSQSVATAKTASASRTTPTTQTTRAAKTTRTTSRAKRG